jgi:SAM-dependent methyltransferase
LADGNYLELTDDEIRTLATDYARLVPVPLALRSAMRFIALSHLIPCGSSVLDVGCGDGTFGLLYPKRASLVVDGVDLDPYEARLAVETKAYRKVEVYDVSETVPEGVYDVALGNCSLEHVPNIHGAFDNISQALKPGGLLLLLLPGFGWTKTLKTFQTISKLSTRVSLSAQAGLDGFFQHHHLYDYQTWTLILESHGFEVTRVGGLGGPKINRLFERGLPFAFLEFLYKKVFKHYPTFTRGIRERSVLDVQDELRQQPIAADSSLLAEYIVAAVKKG